MHRGLDVVRVARDKGIIADHSQHPGGWPPLQPSRAGRRVPAQVGRDGRAADAQLPGHGGDGSPLRPERLHSLIDSDPAGVTGRLCRLLPQRRRFGVPAPAPVHGCDRDRARRRRERYRPADGGVLERRSSVDKEGFQGLAEVLDEVKAIDHLCGCRRAPANAVGVEVAPIATDHGDRRMLGEPSRDRRRRAIGQQVHDAVVREVDQDRAVAVPPSPGPLVDTDGLQGWGARHWGRPHQPEQGGWTGRQAQASGESSPRLPAQRHADGPQDCGQPVGFAGGWRDNVRQALREDAACTARIPADEFPRHELEADGASAPGEVRQLALIVAMERG